MACRSCGKKSSMPRSPFNRGMLNAGAQPAVITARSISVSCVNCPASLRSLSGIVYPMGSGDFYDLGEQDVLNWLLSGYELVFQNPDDREYINGKYSLG